MTDQQDIREDIRRHSLSQSETKATEVRENVDSGSHCEHNF